MFFVLYASIMDDRMIESHNKIEDPGGGTTWLLTKLGHYIKNLRFWYNLLTFSDNCGASPTSSPNGCSTTVIRIEKRTIKKQTVFKSYWKIHANVYKKLLHCVKSVQILSFLCSVFSRFQSKYGKMRNRKNSVFGHFSCSDMQPYMVENVLKRINNHCLKDARIRENTGQWKPVFSHILHSESMFVQFRILNTKLVE